MSATSPTPTVPTYVGQPTDLRSVLFDGADSVGDVRRELTRGGDRALLAGTFAVLADATKAAATTELAKAVDALLGMPLSEVVLRGWSKHVDLREAARRTAANPLVTELVPLADHEIHWSHQPSITVDLDGVPLVTVDVLVTSDLSIHAVRAAVAGGRLTAIHSGACDLAAKVAASVRGGPERVLAERATTIDLRLALQLGAGVPLVGV
jgi:hypothetical protein